MRKLIVLILLFCCAFATAQSARADGKLWAGILLATNQPKADAQPLPPALKPYHERISRFFGYHSFKVIGEQTATLDGANRHLSVSTKHFTLNVDALAIPSSKTTKASKAHKDYQLQFTFAEEKKLLVRASARVAKGSPFLIRGPLCGRGQVLVVLLVK